MTPGKVAEGDLFVFYGLLKQGAVGAPSALDLAGAGAFGAGPIGRLRSLGDIGAVRHVRRSYRSCPH